MELPPELGARIVYFRELKGWNQKRLIRESGILQSRMSKIENDRAKPYFWEVERIALLLEQRLDRFDTLRSVPPEAAPKRAKASKGSRAREQGRRMPGR